MAVAIEKFNAMTGFTKVMVLYATGLDLIDLQPSAVDIHEAAMFI